MSEELLKDLLELPKAVNQLREEFDLYRRAVGDGQARQDARMLKIESRSSNTLVDMRSTVRSRVNAKFEEANRQSKELKSFLERVCERVQGLEEFLQTAMEDDLFNHWPGLLEKLQKRISRLEGGSAGLRPRNFTEEFEDLAKRITKIEEKKIDYEKLVLQVSDRMWNGPIPKTRSAELKSNQENLKKADSYFTPYQDAVLKYDHRDNSITIYLDNIPRT